MNRLENLTEWTVRLLNVGPKTNYDEKIMKIICGRDIVVS